MTQIIQFFDKKISFLRLSNFTAFKCNFDRGLEYCGLKQARDDKFDWSLEYSPFHGSGNVNVILQI